MRSSWRVNSVRILVGRLVNGTSFSVRVSGNSSRIYERKHEENPPQWYKYDFFLSLFIYLPLKSHLFPHKKRKFNLILVYGTIKFCKFLSYLQTTWRGWRIRRKWPLRRTTIGMTSGIGQKKPHHQQLTVAAKAGNVQRNVTTGTGTGTGTRPRPQPIAGTPPPDPSEKCADQKMIQQTCTFFGLDLVREDLLLSREQRFKFKRIEDKRKNTVESLTLCKF